MRSEYDLIIVGGGMVGLAMAASLVDANFKIAIIEKNDFDSLLTSGLLETSHCQVENFDLRVSAISPGNQDFLNTIGIWDLIPESRKANYEWMKVWDADGSGSISFDAAEIARPFLGTIVENQVIRAAAFKRLQSCRNVDFYQGESITKIETNPDCAKLELSSNSQLSAKLLVGADGALSAVRQSLGINSADQPYNQLAFVANVLTEKPHENTAWQRFTSTGPVAFLPLPHPNLCSIVWSIDSDKAENIKSLEPQEFADNLAKVFENKLGKVEAVSNFAGFPLIKRHSEKYLSPSCVLVGDAAHTIHPLAGQGVNLGFQDVACLSRLITSLKEKNRDWSLVANLRPYERERKAENSLMQNAMSGFKWLFGQTSMAPVLARNLALNLADNSGPLKQEIIRRAMGL